MLYKMIYIKRYQGISYYFRIR